MPRRHAIAECERPLKCAFAAGVDVYPGRAKCYESLTLNTLLFGCSLRTFARVMTGRKPTSRTASGGFFRPSERASLDNFASLQFSAQNVLFLTSDLRPPNSDL